MSPATVVRTISRRASALRKRTRAKGRSVIPDDKIIGLPVVSVDKLFLGRKGGKFVDELSALFPRQAFDRFTVSSDVKRRHPRHG